MQFGILQTNTKGCNVLDKKKEGKNKFDRTIKIFFFILVILILWFYNNNFKVITIFYIKVFS